MKTVVYCSLARNYQARGEWVKTTYKKALTTWADIIKDFPNERWSMKIETYEYESTKDKQHVCKHGCAQHLSRTDTWIYSGVQMPMWMRKLGRRL